MATSCAALPGHEVHIYTATPAEVVQQAHVDRCLAVLSEQERERRARFQFDKDKQLYLVAHSLVRAALSRYAPVAPQAWTFTVTEHGRPELSPGQCALGLRFNLSHTDGLVACAIALDRAVGVDVERVHERAHTLSVPERYFAPAEVRALGEVSERRKLVQFFRYWTLKESYIKARGLGLAIPLQQFSFDLDRREGPGIRFEQQLEDDPNRWSFAEFRPSVDHRLAVGVTREPGELVSCQLRRLIPLRA